MNQQPETMVRRIPGILRYLIHKDTFLALGVLAILASALEWLGNLPEPMARPVLLFVRVLLAVYFYLVTRKAAIGKLRLPMPSYYRDTRDTLLLPLIQVGAATWWYWCSVYGWVVITVGVEEFLDRYVGQLLPLLVQEAPWGYLLLGLGLFYLPQAIIGTLVTNRVATMLDPSFGFRRVSRIPLAYAVMFFTLVMLGLVGVGMRGIGTRFVSVLPIPLAAPVIRYLLFLWVPLAQARLLGGFVFHNRVFLARG